MEKCELAGTYHDNYDDLYRKAIKSRDIVSINQDATAINGYTTYSVNMGALEAFITPVVWHNCFHDTEWLGCMEEKRDELREALMVDIEGYINRKFFEAGITH